MLKVQTSTLEFRNQKEKLSHAVENEPDSIGYKHCPINMHCNEQEFIAFSTNNYFPLRSKTGKQFFIVKICIRI
jgi:hypothetical protein